MPLPLDPALVATTDTLPGYQIICSFGVAEGLGVSLHTGFFAKGQKDVLTQITRDAFLNMLAAAAAHGANAIVGLRYATPSVRRNERMVLAYGTAVSVQKL